MKGRGGVAWASPGLFRTERSDRGLSAYRRERRERVRGGTPDVSRVVPCVQSIGHEGIDFWQGRLADDITYASTRFGFF